MNELLAPERRAITLAAVAILLTSALNLSAPAVLAHAIDGPLTARDYAGVLRHAALMLVIYAAAAFCQSIQIRGMGSVAQRVLYRLRGQVFDKLQELPLEFFAEHRAGDLISRMNNDTERVHSFFAQSLMQFVGGFATMLGASFFLLGIEPRLGLAALSPALAMYAVTKLLNPWIRRRNAGSLRSAGDLSAAVAESLSQFEVLVVFNRRDEFRESFARVNVENYQKALGAGVANGALYPFYLFCSQGGTLIVLAYGLSLVAGGEFTVGLLIGYFSYVNRFYDPLRQLANLWSNFQSATAAYERISEVLAQESQHPLVAASPPEPGAGRLEFRGVSFGYRQGQSVLEGVDFRLEGGKTYAFVGPTGGGKTTTASLMARLYDPTQGTVLLDGRDLRSYTPQERSERIGFILQDPFLFAGTVGDNVPSLEGLDSLFPQGLDTPVEGLSLGQRQAVAFLRAVLRRPQLLILDEATANIDTVTESALAALLERLPESTTLVVIAHRLNTIENADAILFVNAGRVQLAGSMEQALALLREEARAS